MTVNVTIEPQVGDGDASDTASNGEWRKLEWMDDGTRRVRTSAALSHCRAECMFVILDFFRLVVWCHISFVPHVDVFVRCVRFW